MIGLDRNPPQRPGLWQDFHLMSSESPEVAPLLRREKIDTVFHLAGGASVPASVENPGNDFFRFVPGTANIALSIARERKECALVLMSSAAVYGNPVSLPVNEDAPICPISPYGVHKALGETMVQHYMRIYGLNVRILRVFSAYGTGLRKQLVWDICQKAFTAVKNGQNEIPLFGTGQETRDFIHAHDVARAALQISMLPVGRAPAIFNVAAGVETRISDIAGKILALIDPRLKIVFSGESRPGDPCNWRADISRLATVGFESTTGMNEGLAEVVAWARGLDVSLIP